MIYYIYKIINLCNGKIYIGMHRTKFLDDGYMGSGKLLKAAIKKYGKENFQKEILEIFDNEEDMISKETELVTDEFVLSENNYNIMPGGKFGSLERNNLTFKSRKHSKDTIEKIRSAAIGRRHSDDSRKKISENNFSKTDPVKQKEHAKKAGSYTRSEEHKRKIAEAIKNKLRSGNYKPGRKKSVGGKSIGADTTL
jgi:group I intron endonuclease